MMAEPVQTLRRAYEPIKAYGKRRVQLVWKNRTASLLFEQRVPGIASPICPCGSSQKGPHTPQRELPSTTRIRLRCEKRPRQRKQLARSAVQGILYNQSHVSTMLLHWKGSSYQPMKTSYYGNSQKVCGRGRGRVRIGTRRH